MLHVGEEGLHVEGRVLDVMLENFAAPARKLDVTCRKSFLLAARSYSYIVYIYIYVLYSSSETLSLCRGLSKRW